MSVKLGLSHRGRKIGWLFENRMLRKIVGPMRNEVTVAGRDSIMRSFIMCTPSQALYEWQNQCGRGRQRVWEREVLHNKFWREGWN
jgi:hypothetical protein